MWLLEKAADLRCRAQRTQRTRYATQHNADIALLDDESHTRSKVCVIVRSLAY